MITLASTLPPTAAAPAPLPTAEVVTIRVSSAADRSTLPAESTVVPIPAAAPQATPRWASVVSAT